MSEGQRGFSGTGTRAESCLGSMRGLEKSIVVDYCALSFQYCIVVRHGYPRIGVNDLLLSQQNQAAHDLFPEFWFQIRMMQREDLYELARKVFRDCRVAICYMGDEINQIAKRDYATVRCRRRRRKEYLAVVLVLIVLSTEVFDI